MKTHVWMSSIGTGLTTGGTVYIGRFSSPWTLVVGVAMLSLGLVLIVNSTVDIR